MRHYTSDNGRIRIGKRTIASKSGKAVRASKANYEQITKVLNSLEDKGCVRIGDTTREGTLYQILLPKDIPLIAEKMVSGVSSESEDDFFNPPENRLMVFERDKWRCTQCKDTETTLCVHHIIYTRKYPWQEDMKNLITLCSNCHRKIHKIKR